MSGLTTTDAGALVPIEFLATVIEFAIGQSQILPRLWRIPMGGHTLRIPQLTQSAGSYFGGIILYHPDELASKTLTEPAFTYKEFTAKELIGLIALSDSLIQDSSINIINYITGVFVRAFQWQQEKEVISGTGLNNQMTGILSDSSINSVARKTHGTVTYDDMINLESALDENFQDLTYLTRRATFNAVRLQKATTNQPVWTYLYPLPGQGSQFNEYPVFKTRNLPAMGTTGDVILGDLGFYIWTVRQDMAIDLSRDRYFEYNATAVRFVMRVDGKPGVSIAFAVLKSTPQS
jgi:HK97 family phage major capsid protein